MRSKLTQIKRLAAIATALIVAVTLYCPVAQVSATGNDTKTNSQQTTDLRAGEELAAEPVRVGVCEFSNTRKVLAGAEMQLLDENGTVMETWTSTTGTHTITTPLVIGRKYTVHQVTAPNGFHENDGDYDVSYCLGYDVDFTIVKMASGESISWSMYFHAINTPSGQMIQKSSPETIYVHAPRSRTVEIGMEALGTAADPNEEFEVILNVPEGVKGQPMSVDLSNATSSKNPSKLTIPSNGSLKASFWLKEGESLTVDGFPLLFGHYYKLQENNQTLNDEAYITHVVANETMTSNEADYIAFACLFNSDGIISKKDVPFVVARCKDLLLPMTAYAATEVLDGAIDVMTDYASNDLFAVDNPVVDPLNDVNEPYLLETIGGTEPFALNDTLSHGVPTMRSADKTGKLTGEPSYMMWSENGVYGDAKVLFINRRDGVPIEKKDDGGNLLEGSKLQVKDSTGEVVHEFTSKKEATTLVALAPGNYKLHEVSAPSGYELAEDIEFTVTDQETVKVDGAKVDAVTMIDTAKAGGDDPGNDNKDNNNDENNGQTTDKTKDGKSASTGDQIMIGLAVLLMALAAAAIIILARRKKSNQ